MKLTFFLFAFLAIAGCGSSNKIQGKEVARIPAPGGRAVAILTQTGGDSGATVGFGNAVYLQGTGSQSRAEQVLLAYRNETPVLTWVDGSHLNIRLRCGEVLSFSNFATVHYSAADNVLEQVVVKLDNDGLCSDR